MTEIIFNTNNFKSEHISLVTDFLTNKIAESSALELSTLKSIVITDNFDEDVAQLQKRYGTNEPGHTQAAEVTAVTKVVHTGIGDDLVQSIVVNDYIIAGLFSDALAESCFHYLHHELGHVHDNYNQHQMFGKEARMGNNLNELEHTLVCHANSIWSEYIAVRLSSSSFPISSLEESPAGTLFGSPLLQLLELCKQSIEDAISDYRNHGDILSLFLYCQEVSSIVLKNAATTQGYIDGLNLSNTETENVITDLMRQSYLNECWVKLWGALRALYDSYPEWNDECQLLDLGKAVEYFWNELGIFPAYVEEKEYVYVNVPFADQ